MSTPAQQETTASPFHFGERDVQQRAGVREEAEKRGQRMLTAELNPKQVEFFQQLPFVIAAHTDDSGQPWASLITGKPGFIGLENHNTQCSIDWRQAHNPNNMAIQAKSSLGLLGIELATRRRNRMNATVVSAEDASWRMAIEQGYGNCPKYINERPWPEDLFSGVYAMEEDPGLSESASKIISVAVTTFIATSSGPRQTDPEASSSAWGADVSHRGGESGFIAIEDGKLAMEDYPGNNMFNTLGNISLCPRCGLLALDFNTGNLLQLAATAKLEHKPNGRTLWLTIDRSRLFRRVQQP